MRGQDWIAGAVAAWVAGCSSGGGSSSSAPAVQIGFGSGTSTTAEGTQIQVPVVLTLKKPLAADLTVTVTDAGVGSATSGLDYAFAAQQVTFAAGSADGATGLVSLTPTADDLVEGANETVRLALTAPSAGKLSGALHTLTIQDGDMASIGFASAASTAPNESAGTHVVTVELALDPGDALSVDVTATLSDAGTGTATGGSDYAAFAPQVVTFLAGSVDGDTIDVTLTLMNDAVAEGDETIVFALSGPGAGALVDGTGTHVVTITEDDLGDQMMAVSVDGLAVSGGEIFALGSNVPLGTLGQSVQLDLQNLGSAPIDLSVLQLSGDAQDFRIEAPESALPTIPDVGAFPLAASGNGGLKLSSADRAWLADKSHVVLHGAPLPGGGETSLELWRLPSPWHANARIDVDGEPLEGGIEALVGEISLWRGAIVGEPGSRVFLAFSEHGSQGWIRPEHGSAGEVVFLADEGAETHVAWSATLEPEGGPATCAGVREVPGAAASDFEVSVSELALAGVDADQAPGTAGSNAPGIAWAEATLALETDYQLYQKFGNASALSNYVTQLIAAISDVYERDFETRLSIAYLGVHTSASDGWTSQDSGGDSGDLLDEFQAAWGSSSWPVQADIAHFLSGASLGGGVAYLDVLCNPYWSFGVSGNLHGQVDWSTFDGSSGNLTWDFVVVAHEIGHNFGTTHTHSYCPPLDLCYTNCQGGSACPQGTIMSYCHVCGGMANIDLEFHPYVAQVVRAKVAASCLGMAQLLPGATASFLLRFAPTSSAGAKSADLGITHGATNLPSPLSIELTGTAQ